MINTEINGNGVDNAVTPAQDKQLPGALKKTALRDVQNENVGSNRNHQESLPPGGGKSSAVCGTKRLTPERPSSSQALLSLAYNGTNENVMNARKRFEFELGGGRPWNNVDKISDHSESKNVGQLRPEAAQKMTQMRDSNPHHISVATSHNLTPTVAFASSGPSIPSSFGKQSNSIAAPKVSSELPRTVDSKGTSDQMRNERFIRLQKFLKQCDEASQREYAKRLLRLSPAELSKHAVELEKRAIQLTMEEANEIQRKNAMNIFAKSSPMNHLLQPTQVMQSSNR